MPTIVVLVKHVPDTWSQKKLSGDFTLDRDNVDEVIDEINEYAVEQALKIREADAEAGWRVVALTAGTGRAEEALRKALAMGVDDAVLLSDEGIAGSDLPGTAWSLTCGIDAAMSALGLDELKLIVTGNRSSDGLMGGMAGILSEYRTIPALTHLRSATVNAAEGTVTGVRETPKGEFELAAALPAVISVTDQADRPRFPNFKGIMAAKKAQITRLSLADTAASPEQVGGSHAATAVTAATERPERGQGEIIRDNGRAAVAIADFLESRNLI
ncbi:electron transfer flavoprotein subunit beta/FixA family protein [Corynebacterium sp. P7003]|uniref:Electron transfer flavoprotein subunit beta n=1 Tax=Corynebacterium pygosceleis TaxID=2800406 RepID=A0ABT3WUE6_9CORY|nr:electron transfer flavoprotein subunit beta/FixA family protein [Corynebacterium pygosceleis]MCX7444559.1 electron transfer flavoprotein subunit beta/FixA family protein [Corynebacterium pygosceleis]